MYCQLSWKVKVMTEKQNKTQHNRTAVHPLHVRCCWWWCCSVTNVLYEYRLGQKRDPHNTSVLPDPCSENRAAAAVMWWLVFARCTHRTHMAKYTMWRHQFLMWWCCKTHETQQTGRNMCGPHGHVCGDPESRVHTHGASGERRLECKTHCRELEPSWNELIGCIIPKWESTIP